MLRAIGLLAALASGTLAQTTYTAHPIDVIPPGAASSVPLGGGNPDLDEARTQLLIPAAFLPTTGGRLDKIEFYPNYSAVIPYDRFELWLDHVTIPALSPVFAQNLTAPQLVFDRSRATIDWHAHTFQALHLDPPFFYDGHSNLLLEIRKKIDRANHPVIPFTEHAVMDFPRRQDLPLPLWTTGPAGSGAVDAELAQTAHDTLLLFWLLWDAAPTTYTASTRNYGRDFFHLGSTMEVMAMGQPWDFYVQAIDFRLLPAALHVPGLSGGLWLAAPQLLAFGRLDWVGRGGTTFVLPHDPNLVGLHTYFQTAMIGPTEIVLSSVADAQIAPF